MKKILYIALCAIALVGCKKEQESKRQYWEAEMEQVQVEIVRFDQALLNVQEETVAEDVRRLYADYPEFMPIWVENIVGISAQDTAALVQLLPSLLNDTIYVPRQKLKQFDDISDLQSAFNQAFTRIKWLYPEFEVPMIYFFLSGYSDGLFMEDDIIGVGVDMYLGQDFETYDKIATIYSYQKQTMYKGYIPVEVTYYYLLNHVPYINAKNWLLYPMLYNGKIMFLTAQLFDQMPNYEVMGWTQDQWNWCTARKRDMWHYIMDQRHLYSDKPLIISNYLKEAPFTSEFTQDCPGRAGVWIGWRIVESYMEHNPEVTMQELMAETDAQKILELSSYRP